MKGFGNNEALMSRAAEDDATEHKYKESQKKIFPFSVAPSQCEGSGSSIPQASIRINGCIIRRNINVEYMALPH